MFEYLFLLSNMLFWSTLGATEGFKWTGSPKIVNAKNYHIFRAFTNGAFLLALIIAPLIFNDISITQIALKVFITLCASWPVYEFALNYVNHGKILKQKGDFVFGDKTFKHPPVILIPILWIISLGCFVWFI